MKITKLEIGVLVFSVFLIGLGCGSIIEKKLGDKKEIRQLTISANDVVVNGGSYDVLYISPEASITIISGCHIGKMETER